MRNIKSALFNRIPNIVKHLILHHSPPPMTHSKPPASIEMGRQCRCELPAVKGGWRPLRRLALPMLLSPPRSPQKNEPPMRGSLALSEFVLKTAGSRFGAMILELKTGRKRNGGLKRIKEYLSWK